MEADRIREARGVAAELAALGAPRQETKEVIEACLGLRVTRLQLSPKGVAVLHSLGKKFGFGVVPGRYAIRSAPTHGLGRWSDGIGEAVDLSDPDAAVNVYLARTDELADRARHAEEEEGDDAFGAILGIPECCCDFYQRGLAAVVSGTDCFHWLVARSLGPQNDAAPGCNFFGRYFGGSLLSHFPCSLCCEKSVGMARRTRDALKAVDAALTDALTDTHYWGFLVKRRGPVIAYPVVKRTSVGAYSVTSGITPPGETTIPPHISGAQIFLDALSLRIVGHDGIEQSLNPDEAKFVYAGASL